MPHVQHYEFFWGWTESIRFFISGLQYHWKDSSWTVLIREFLRSSLSETGTERKQKSPLRSIQVWPLKEGIHTFPFRRGDISDDPVCLKQTKPPSLSSFALASLCFADHAPSGLRNMKLLCPHFTYSTDLHHILSPSLPVCSSL